MRKHRRQTDLRLVFGFFLLLLFVGDGLILLIYGGRAAVSGLFCIGAGAFLVAMLWGILTVLEWVGNHTGQW